MIFLQSINQSINQSVNQSIYQWIICVTAAIEHSFFWFLVLLLNSLTHSLTQSISHPTVLLLIYLIHQLTYLLTDWFTLYLFTIWIRAVVSKKDSGDYYAFSDSASVSALSEIARTNSKITGSVHLWECHQNRCWFPQFTAGNFNNKAAACSFWYRKCTRYTS